MARKLTASGLSRAKILVACARELLQLAIGLLPPAQHGFLRACDNMLTAEADRLNALPMPGETTPLLSDAE